MVLGKKENYERPGGGHGKPLSFLFHVFLRANTMAPPVSGQVSSALASLIIMLFFMAPKRKANAAQSSPSKTKAAKASAGAEEAARVAGTGQVDPSCTVPGAQLCRGDDGAFFDAMCNQTNLEKNANKYYVIQLVENEDSEYFVFTRWGRVGESGAVQQVGPLDRAAGEKQFNSKFKEKTGNAWDARANFVTMDKKYSLVVLEHDPPAAAAACAAGGGKGKEEASSKGKGKEEAVTKTKSTGKNEKRLLTAAEKGDTQQVLKLLKEGTDINAADENSRTALHWAAAHGLEALAQGLLGAGADINAADAFGMTPLHYAASQNVKVAKVLLANGAQVNVRNEDGDTALAYAMRRGHPEMEALLRQHGAE